MDGSKRETKEGGVPCWISFPRLMSGRPTGRLPSTKKAEAVGPSQRNFSLHLAIPLKENHTIGYNIAKQGSGSFIGLI